MLLEQNLLYVPNISYSIWFNFIGTWIGFQGDFHLLIKLATTWSLVTTATLVASMLYN